MAYKTPGVYVEEISTLPPSVAEVETAIPAFIGYTQIAKNQNDDLTMVPTRISSMVEYESYFGFAANEDMITVNVSGNNIVVNEPSHADKQPFLMYYSMQMFFANGGGPCYIVSVGQYGIPVSPATSPVYDDLLLGLKAANKQDEPTLLIFPDATFLTEATEFYPLYNQALAACAKLQDRFTIVDTFTDSKTSIAALRSEITSDPLLLKYGAAYNPFLKTILKYSYLDSQVMVHDSTAPSYANQVTALSDSIDQDQLHDLIEILKDAITNLSSVTPLSDAKLAVSNATEAIQTFMSDASSKLTSISNVAAEALVEHPSSPAALTAAKTALDPTWKGTNLTTPSNNITNILAVQFAAASTSAAAVTAANLIKTELGIPATPLDGKIAALKVGTGEIKVMVDLLVAPPYQTNVNAYLSSYALTNNTLYNQIKAKIALLGVTLPPSATMAGIYARVDAASGVWSAPANATINYIVGATRVIDNDEQEGMNVTPTGKSVNAIRSFTGRGNLVWGARTLTGNSNEWRYVSVRRFFNFAEESIKKATEAFVFQANDANTWVKVSGMIESFLTQQWKAGALAGAKTEQAFYVSIGLGQTMTAQDILEGRMIVEIGMAVVRPAEFIVLRFTHMMQEA